MVDPDPRYMHFGASRACNVNEESLPERRTADLVSDTKKKPVRIKWLETGSFNWGEELQKSFQYTKDAISDNVMGCAHPDVQYDLTTDASKLYLGGFIPVERFSDRERSYR